MKENEKFKTFTATKKRTRGVKPYTGAAVSEPDIKTSLGAFSCQIKDYDLLITSNLSEDFYIQVREPGVVIETVGMKGV